jgi:3-hydroxy-3-methylglutaryl CoA synthase
MILINFNNYLKQRKISIKDFQVILFHMNFNKNSIQEVNLIF